MAIFVDKNNEKNAIRIAGALAFTVFSFIGYQIGCNKSKFKIYGVEVTPQLVEQKREDVKDKVNEFKEQLKILNAISKDELPTVLKDSIAKLIYIRQKDINQAEELLTTFEKFNDLSENDKVSFMEKVLNYLSQKVYPNRYKDFGDIAKNIVTNNKMEILNKLNTTLKFYETTA